MSQFISGLLAKSRKNVFATKKKRHPSVDNRLIKKTRIFIKRAFVTSVNYASIKPVDYASVTSMSFNIRCVFYHGDTNKYPYVSFISRHT